MCFYVLKTNRLEDQAPRFLPKIIMYICGEDGVVKKEKKKNSD